MTPDDIRALLKKTRRIAVVGLSPVATRPSHYVAQYLQKAGYEILPVTPRAPRLLGARCYPNVRDLPGGVDLVAVFRAPAFVPAVARECLRVGPAGFWMVPGAESDEAAALLRPHGIAIVSGRCLLETHRALVG